MKVRSTYAEPVSVGWLGGRWVDPGEVVAIPDDQLENYLEAGWRPADDRTLAAARELIAAGKTTFRLPGDPADEEQPGDESSSGEGE